MCLKTVSLFLILGFVSLAQGKHLSAWVGDDVELHCIPNHRPGTDDPLDWSRYLKWTAMVDGYDKRLIFHYDGDVDKENFTRPYEYDLETHSIHLEDVSEEDSTTWQCELDNSNLYPGKQQLQVYKKPEIEVVQEAMHLEDSGEQTKAVCTVNNMNKNFEYEVFWTGNLEEANISDPETTDNEDGSFSVRISYSVNTDQDITRTDLTCNLKLKNWNGSAGVENFIENKSMKLQVITTTTQAPTTPTPVAPVISKKHWDEVEVFEVGTEREYKCKARGSQDITYEWHKNGEKVWTGQTITVKVESMDEHGDIYKCIATNQIGTQHSQFQLDVQGEPRFEVAEEEVYIEPSEDTKEIVCDVNSNPTADKFVWSVKGSEMELEHVVEENQSTATLKRSELNEEGVNEIVCTASNGKGAKTKTFKVQLKSAQVMSGGMIALVVFIVLFLFGATGAGVLVVKRRQQQGGDEDVEQNLCYRGLLCNKGGVEEKEKEEGEEKGEVGPAENEDVKDEVDEEKQNLTEKTKENEDKNEEKTEEAGEKEAMLEKEDGEAPKKKKRFQGLRGPLGCCKKSRKQLQENEEEEDKVNEEGDPSSQEEVKDQEKELKEDESDRDSGKGDTLKPNMDAEVDK